MRPDRSGWTRTVKFKSVLWACAFSLASGVACAADAPAIPAPPELGLKAFILVDFDTGQVLAEKDSAMRAEPASLTKIMTVYTVADAIHNGHIKMEDTTIVSEHAWKQEGSRMFLDLNKPVSIDLLLHGDIIQSGNDASVALAEHVSGTEETFAIAMNQHAERLGMKDTHFVNSTGLPDPEHYTTAHDLSVLGRALIRDFPDIYKIFSQPEYTYNGIHQQNRNGLLGKDPSVDGIKTGHTESAGYCLVGSAKRDGMRLISVVMGAASNGARTKASQALLNYGYRYYETRRLYEANATVATAQVWRGTQNSVKIGPAEGAGAITFPRGQFAKIKATVDLPTKLEAPVKLGQQIAEARLELDGKLVATIPLIAQEAIEEGSFIGQLIDRARLMMQ